MSQVFRFYDKTTGDHFFTADAAEAAHIEATLPSLVVEGSPWAKPDKGADTADVFRFLDTSTGEPFFTTSTGERDSMLSGLPSYQYEGVGFQAYAAEGAAYAARTAASSARATRGIPQGPWSSALGTSTLTVRTA